MKKLLFACAALTLALAPAAFSEQTPPPATQTADPNTNVAAPGVTFNARPAAPAPAAPSAGNEMLVQVQRLLSADWRPVDTSGGGQMVSAIQAACTGTDEEMTALHSRLTPNMTVAQIRQIRNPHGLIILPGHTPSSVVFFPNAQLSWVTAGMGTLIVQDIDHARIDVRDTMGAILQLQLAQARTGQAILRVLHDNQQVGLYVACASTVPSQPAANASAPAAH